jgi:hypothetical protein
VLLSKINERTRSCSPAGPHSPDDKSRITLFIYFDEAKCLHERNLIHVSKDRVESIEVDERTTYHALILTLDEFRDLNIFFLFLSTTSKLSNPAPAKQVFQSLRSSSEPFDLQAPFTEMPFDLYAKVKENKHSLNEICTVYFMSQFGRPL